MLLVRSGLRWNPLASGAIRAMSSSGGSTVVCEEPRPDKGIITLNRPKALNAINLDMVMQIGTAMKAWQQAGKNLVLMRGAGEKAFCAGGDVRAVTEGALDVGKNFFREEYRVNALINSYRPDYVALIDGITMGGGVGLSVHGKYRVATERTLFAMPETAIGLFPDVGGSHFLPRLAGRLGMYLGLTGFRLKGADVFKAGVATHYVESKDVPALEQALIETKSSAEVEAVLKKFHVSTPEEFVLAKHQSQIDRCFSGATVEQILANLEQDGSDWARKTLALLAKMSPCSLKVTHKQLQLGAQLPDLRACLKMEYRMAVHAVIESDFKEGVRAVLVDRDQNPRWSPASLAEVSAERVNRFFGPLPDGTELVFEDELKAAL